MPKTVRKLIVLSSQEAEEAQNLADTNCPKPGGGGNISELIRQALAAAVENPELFGFKPSAVPVDRRDETERHLQARAEQADLDPEVFVNG